jgi:hypothetical protein
MLNLPVTYSAPVRLNLQVAYSAPNLHIPAQKTNWSLNDRIECEQRQRYSLTRRGSRRIAGQAALSRPAGCVLPISPAALSQQVGNVHHITKRRRRAPLVDGTGTARRARHK